MAVTGINDLVRDVEAIKAYTANLLAQNEYSDTNRANTGLVAGMPSPQDYLSYLKLVSKKLATPEGEIFLAQQGILKLMNPTFGTGKLYNPASALGPQPYAGGMTTDFLEGPLAAMNDGERLAIREDKLRTLTEGKFNDSSRVTTLDTNTVVSAFRYPDGKTIEQNRNQNNIFSPEEQAKDYEYIDNTNFVDGGLNGRKTINKNGVDYDVPDYQKLFDKSANGPGFRGENKGAYFFAPKRDTKDRVNQETFALQQWFEDDDTFMTQEDFQNGYMDTEQDTFLDDQFYIPFYFEDLRKERRYISFRAFLDNFSETFSPNWSSEHFFGRVDPVVSYKNTGRKINISFKVMPKSAPGFSAAWRKINNLTKMVYPTFSQGTMVRGPMIRMRVGDVISTDDGRGLPGFIESMDLNYSGAPWEVSYFNGPTTGIELGKAPMKIEVNLTFTVIHEQNLGVDNDYNFNFSKFRRVGTPQSDTVAASQPEDMTFTLDEESTNNTSTPEGAV